MQNTIMAHLILPCVRSARMPIPIGIKGANDRKYLGKTKGGLKTKITVAGKATHMSRTRMLNKSIFFEIKKTAAIETTNKQYNINPTTVLPLGKDSVPKMDESNNRKVSVSPKSSSETWYPIQIPLKKYKIHRQPITQPGACNEIILRDFSSQFFFFLEKK